MKSVILLSTARCICYNKLGYLSAFYAGVAGTLIIKCNVGQKNRGAALNIRRKNRGDKLVPLERSRRTIQLEKRGRRLKRYVVPARIFAVLGVGSIFYCAGIAVAGFGTLFFLIWGGIGVFLKLVCLILYRNSKPKKYKNQTQTRFK